MPFGVLQGSVLGPLLFVLYTAELSEVVAAYGLTLHQYADNCQIYIATPASDASSAVIRLQECLCQVNAWMSSSRLRLNHKKTEVMWLGSRQQLDKLSFSKSRSCQVQSLSAATRATWASLLTVNSVCQATSMHSVGAAIIS